MLNCVTWNMQGGTGANSIVEKLIQREGADVVFLQESAERGDTIGNIYDYVGNSGRGANKVHYEGTRMRWHGGYQGATSIVLRQGLGATLSGTIAHPTGDGRGVLYTTIPRAGMTLYLCSIHAWSPSGNDWDKVAGCLLNEIVNLVGNNPVIAGGDFNKAAGREKNIGSWELAGGSQMSGGTLDGFWLYNLPQNGYGDVNSVGVYNSNKGDHFPVWMQINL